MCQKHVKLKQTSKQANKLTLIYGTCNYLIDILDYLTQSLESVNYSIKGVDYLIEGKN